MTAALVRGSHEWVECRRCRVFMPASYVIYHELDPRPRCVDCGGLVDDLL